MDVEKLGVKVQANSTLDGEVDGLLIMTSQNQFSVPVTSATGQDVFWTDLSGDITMPIDEGFLPPGLGFQYNCSGSVLTLQGFINGTTETGAIYYYDRA